MPALRDFESRVNWRPARVFWTNVVVGGLVTTSLWLVCVWLGILATRGWAAATTGIDSNVDLGGTFVFWLIICAPAFTAGSLLYECVIIALAGRNGAWENVARRALLAPLILVPVSALSPGGQFIRSPIMLVPGLCAVLVYALVVRRRYMLSVRPVA